VIPPESLVMGAPAKVKRPLTSDEIEKLAGSWKNYVELSKQYLSKK
jgi:carbonic anhydrase/acetyltransferase-like protein (isoleucine patch superfamily)